MNNLTTDRLAAFVAMAKAFSQMSYQGVYLYDFSINRFLYASNYPLLLGNLNADTFCQTGLAVFTQIAPEEEIVNALKIEGALRSGFEQIPAEKHKDIVLSFNINIFHKERPILVAHKLSLLECDEIGRPLIALGLAAPSANSIVGEVIVKIKGDTDIYRYDEANGTWQKQTAITLSDDELRMLRLTMQGHSVEQIADIMCRSINTIKFYRKQVFQKMEVHNTSEAISYAIHNCMI